MSTKIYNAYLWNDNIENLLLYLKEYKKQYISDVVNYLIKHREHLEKEIDKTEHKSLYCFLLEEKNKSIDYSNFYTFIGSFIIYPHLNKIAVQKFTENFSNIELDNRLTDYHYQNQTDSDNTEEEDNERRIFWNDYNVPEEDGFCYDLITNKSLYEIYREYYKAIKNV